MLNPVFNLPVLQFVGGQSQTLSFNLLTTSGGIFHADGCSINFSVVSYTDRNSVPLISKSAELIADNDGYMNTAVVELDPTETVGLYGKYIYQITVNDGGTIEIPGQGIANIQRNINPDLITK